MCSVNPNKTANESNLLIWMWKLLKNIVPDERKIYAHKDSQSHSSVVIVDEHVVVELISKAWSFSCVMSNGLETVPRASGVCVLAVLIHLLATYTASAKMYCPKPPLPPFHLRPLWVKTDISMILLMFMWDMNPQATLIGAPTHLLIYAVILQSISGLVQIKTCRQRSQAGACFCAWWRMRCFESFRICWSPGIFTDNNL